MSDFPLYVLMQRIKIGQRDRVGWGVREGLSEEVAIQVNVNV